MSHRLDTDCDTPYYRMFNLKRNRKTITSFGTKIKSEAGPPPCNRLSPRDTRVKVTLVARPLLTTAAQKLCRCEHSVFTSRTCVHSRTFPRIDISFAVVREAFSNAYPDKELLNKTTIQRLVTKFWDTGSVHVSSRRWWTSAVKLFCSSSQIETIIKLVCLVILMSPKLTNTVVFRVAF
jgi:hypothetical protein